MGYQVMPTQAIHVSNLLLSFSSSSFQCGVKVHVNLDDTCAGSDAPWPIEHADHLYSSKCFHSADMAQASDKLADETVKRRQVLFAFWAVFLLGLPMWYLTTQVSRAPLPELPSWPMLRPVFPLDIQTQVPSFRNLAAQIISQLNPEQSVYQFTQDINGAHQPWTLRVKQETEETIRFDNNESRSIEVSLPASYSAEQSSTVITKLLQNLTSNEQRNIAASRVSARASADLRVVNYAPEFHLLFSLMNGGGRTPFLDWPIDDILGETVDPLLASLDALSNFVVESQVQHYAELTFEPIFDEQSKEHILLPSDLSNVINAAEWPLATAENDAKPLNFIIYVPKPDHRPLIIKQDGHAVRGNAFLLPQFGSVVIYNPPANETGSTLDAAVLRQLMQTCTSHLLTLLGLGAEVEGLPDHSLWRRDAFYRGRLVELLISAQQTLSSIPKMVDELPNMHVPEHVAVRMTQAITHVDTALLHTTTVQHYDLEGALRHAREAVALAETAFFDDKMVSLLYFPQEHKYGVYMPLFGPLLLPLGLSLLKEIKGALARRRQRRQAAQLVDAKKTQ
jgi:phosphatidylinositol glycan class S